MNILSSIKSIVLRRYNRKKFPTSVIYSGVNIDKDSHLGRYSVLFKDVALIKSELGAYSYVQSGSVICNTEIGNFCSIASNVHIGLASHPTHMVSTSPIFYDNSQPLPKFIVDKVIFFEELPKTTIGSDVWIGHGVIVKAGVSIGIGAVIGAGSVVTKDIPPYSIAVGAPCKVLRRRFKLEIIDELLNSKWWDFDDEGLILLAEYFSEPELFLARCKK